MPKLRTDKEYVFLYELKNNNKILEIKKFLAIINLNRLDNLL